MESSKKLLSLNREQIKYVVIVAMLIDHIAWAFVPKASLLGQLMHFIGRLTGPTMAYFIVEGYLHTRNVKRYAFRLGIFAVISIVPFTLFEYGTLPIVMDDGEPLLITSFGVIYTLFLSLLAVWLWDKGRCREWVKAMGVAGLCILSIAGDWAFYDVIFALLFFVFRDEPKKKWAMYCLFSASLLVGAFVYGEYFQVGVFMVPLLIEFCYNGEGGSRKPFHKWFFYVFYPAHLLILWALSAYVF